MRCSHRKIFKVCLAIFQHYGIMGLKSKNNINLNLVNLAQITFPDAISFSILGERRCSLFLIETMKPQQQDSLVPSLAEAKK